MPGPKVKPQTIALLRQLGREGKSAQKIFDQIGNRVSLRTIYRYLDEMGLIKKQPKPNKSIPAGMRETFRQFVVDHSPTLHPHQIRDLWNEGPGISCPVSLNQVMTRQRKCNCTLSLAARATHPYMVARRKARREKAALRQIEARKQYRKALHELQKQMLQAHGNHNFQQCPHCGTNWLLTKEFFQQRGRKHLKLLTDICLACDNEKGVNKRLVKGQLEEFQAFLRANASKMHPEELTDLWNETYYRTSRGPRICRTLVDLWLKRLNLRLSPEQLAALPYSQEKRKQAAATRAAKLRKSKGKRQTRVRVRTVSSVIVSQLFQFSQRALHKKPRQSVRLGKDNSAELFRTIASLHHHSWHSLKSNIEKQKPPKIKYDNSIVRTVAKLYHCATVALQEAIVIPKRRIPLTNPLVSRSLIAELYRLSAKNLSAAPAVKRTQPVQKSKIFTTIAHLLRLSTLSLQKKLPERTVRQSVVRTPRVSFHYIALAFHFSQTSLQRCELRVAVRKKRSRSLAESNPSTPFAVVGKLFEVSNASLQRQPTRQLPQYAIGKCVFCRRTSRRLLLLPGRESRGLLCPKCFEKVRVMSDRRLAILDQLMQKQQEMVQLRKECRRLQGTKQRPKTNRRTSTSRYDDDDAFLDLFSEQRYTDEEHHYCA